MNFLAHLVLAPASPQGLVGSIAPDLIRGPLPKDLDPEVAEAAAEHQRIDRFTDTHPAFAHSRQHAAKAVLPRLSGVLTDVLYDHILAHGWSRWRSDPLDRFIGETEKALAAHTALMPLSMQWVVQKMIDEHWLSSYATEQGLHDRLTQMSARLSRRFDREVNLCPPLETIATLRSDCADDFSAFWPELRAFVSSHRRDAADRRAS